MRRRAFMDDISQNVVGGGRKCAAQALPGSSVVQYRRSRGIETGAPRRARVVKHELLLVDGLGCLDQVGADLALELLPHRLHGFTPLGTLLGSQGDDLGGAGSQDALLVTLVQFVGQTVNLDADL